MSLFFSCVLLLGSGHLAGATTKRLALRLVAADLATLGRTKRDLILGRGDDVADNASGGVKNADASVEVHEYLPCFFVVVCCCAICQIACFVDVQTQLS